jgi:hypothetical protein
MPPLIRLELLLLLVSLLVASLLFSNPAEKSRNADGVRIWSFEKRLKSLLPVNWLGSTLIIVLIGPEYDHRFWFWL